MNGFVGALWFLLFLQSVTALGRLYVRTAIVQKFGLDDVAVILTWLLSTAFSGCLLAINYTTGNEAANKIPANLLFPTVKTVLACELCYIAGAACLKIALGLLLLRVLFKRWQVYTIYVVLVVATTYSLGFFFIILFQCGNPSKFAPRFLTNSCLRPDVISGLSYTHAVINAASDWIFAILPVFFLIHTNISLRAKISVGGILALGSVGSICTVVRIGWVHYLTVPTTNFLLTSEGIGIMSAAELSIGIACASISTYKPLFTRYFSAPNVSDCESSEMSQTAYSESTTPRKSPNMSIDGDNWNLKDSGFVSSCASPTSERKFNI